MKKPKSKCIFFYKNWFYLQKKVFWPRFETEQLTDLIIQYAKVLFAKKVEILEVGTGSGVVALSLGKADKNWSVDGIDINFKAIKLAKKNQLKLKVTTVHFWQSDLFTKVDKKYDLIVANLPYVGKNEPQLDQKVFYWDPINAIIAKNNGLELIKKFLENVKKFLKERYLIALEIGFQQSVKVIQLVKKELPNANLKTRKDFNNINRFIFIYQLK